VPQAAQLLENASPEMLPTSLLAFLLVLAALKFSDWTEIDFDNGLIAIKGLNKVNTRRLVTMQPNLREWLLPFRKRSGKVVPDNFPNLDNGLRHSFASYHLARFRNAAMLAEEMGSSAQIIRKHYDGRAKPRDVERSWNIRAATTEKVVPIVAQA
jgi:integrase